MLRDAAYQKAFFKIGGAKTLSEVSDESVTDKKIAVWKIFGKFQKSSVTSILRMRREIWSISCYFKSRNIFDYTSEAKIYFDPVNRIHFVAKTSQVCSSEFDANFALDCCHNFSFANISLEVPDSIGLISKTEIRFDRLGMKLYFIVADLLQYLQKATDSYLCYGDGHLVVDILKEMTSEFLSNSISLHSPSPLSLNPFSLSQSLTISHYKGIRRSRDFFDCCWQSKKFLKWKHFCPNSNRSGQVRYGGIRRSSASPRPPSDGNPSTSVWPSPSQTPGPSSPYPSDRLPHFLFIKLSFMHSTVITQCLAQRGFKPRSVFIQISLW